MTLGVAHRMSGADGDSGPELSDDEEMSGFATPASGSLALQKPAGLRATPSSPLELKLKDLYQTVINYVLDGRVLSVPFMVLPTRLEFPLYYEVIIYYCVLSTIHHLQLYFAVFVYGYTLHLYSTILMW